MLSMYARPKDSVPILSSSPWYPLNNLKTKYVPTYNVNSNKKCNFRQRSRVQFLKSRRNLATEENNDYLEDFVKCIIEPDEK